MKRQAKQDASSAQGAHEQRVRELEQQLIHYTECATRLQCECDRLMQMTKQLDAEKEKQFVELNKHALTLHSPLSPAFLQIGPSFLEIGPPFTQIWPFLEIGPPFLQIGHSSYSLQMFTTPHEIHLSIYANSLQMYGICVN